MRTLFVSWGFLLCVASSLLMLVTVLQSWAELFYARADLSYANFLSLDKNTTRGAPFLRSSLNTLCEIALNSFLIHFLATKIVTNESWTILEYAYLS